MNSDFKLPSFGQVPDTYQARYVQQLLRQLDAVLIELRAAGALRSGTLNLAEIPEYSVSLRNGDVFISDGGVLKIVWSVPAEAATNGAIGSVGTVTVSTP